MVTKVADTTSKKNMEQITHNNIKKERARRVWQKDVLWHLRDQGLFDVAEDLQNCGSSFFVKVCHANPSHAPKAIPKLCKLRIHESCEHRESYRKSLRYLPTLRELLKPNPEHPEYFLLKLVLTTPYSLSSLTSESLKQKQQFVNDCFSVMFFWYFHERGELSKQEIKSGRCNLKQHGLGWLCAAEFGERGKKLHWHCLLYAPFISHMDWCAVWKDVTDGECQNTSVMSIYAGKDGVIGDAQGLEGALDEVVKYATKFTSLPAQDVPHLFKVLKGNRRFRTGGIFNGIKLPDKEECDCKCKECGAELELLSTGGYVTRCINMKVAIDDSVTEIIESGFLSYLSSELEISSGSSPLFHRKARDDTDEDG